MKKIELRPAMPDDAEFLLELRNSPVIVALGQSGTYAAPEWLDGVIDVVWAPVGYLRFDRNLKTDEIELSIVIEKGARGQGIGPAALKMAAKRYAGRFPVVAYIKPDNPVSIHAFSKAGFEHDGHTDRGLLRFVAR